MGDDNEADSGGVAPGVGDGPLTGGQLGFGAGEYLGPLAYSLAHYNIATTVNSCITNNVPYTLLQRIQGNNQNASGFGAFTANQLTYIDGCRALVTGGAGGSGFRAFGGSFVATNCIATGMNFGFRCQDDNASIINCVANGCTIDGVIFNGTSASQTLVLENTVFYDNANDVNDTTVTTGSYTKQYNAYTTVGTDTGDVQVSTVAGVDMVDPSNATLADRNTTPVAGGVLESNGVFNADVTTDINGEPRENPPDIGAFEISGGGPYWYINTDNVSGTADGKTRATGFLTLQSAIASVTGADPAVPAGGVFFKCAGATNPDVTGVNVNGFTGHDTNNRINIVGDDDADDSPDGDPTPGAGAGRYIGNLNYSTSHYRFEAPTEVTNSITLTLPWTTIDGIQIAVPGELGRSGVNCQPIAGGEQLISNSRFISLGNTEIGNQTGISGQLNKTDATFTIENNIFADLSSTTDGGRGVSFVEEATRTNVVLEIRSNTIAGCDAGIVLTGTSSTTGQLNIRNNACVNIPFLDFDNQMSTSQTVTVTNNAGKAADQSLWPTGWQDVGTTPWSGTFTDVAGGDYTPTNTNSVLVGNAVAGAPLTAEDIRAITRLDPDTIGSFFLASGAPPEPPTANRPRIQIIG
jgi:hypothetical protein